ncbi:MAG: ATP-dependent DNA ligase, partial [Actinobacteria bacterium]|nr:ATP-dependent DNA ligase [Actinomycetota bacterium]
MRFEEVARASIAIGETRSRLEKIERLAACLRGLRPDEVRVAVAYLSGELPQGSIGIGWAALRDLPPAASSTLTMGLLDVDATLSRIASMSGSGSQAARRLELTDLFGRATERERRFLLALLTGELRQGAQAGVMIEALAKAAGVPASDVRRAHMLSGDLGAVAEAALAQGAAGLARFRLSVLTPLQPMLAQSAAGVPEAFARIRPAAVEWKLDGARIQVHRLGEEVRVFTRNLADVTERLPEVVESARELPAEGIILDGETIALRAGGRPHPFQVTMGRFGSRVSVEEVRAMVPLSPFFFDCLHVDGDDLIDLPATERFAVLSDRVPERLRVSRLVTDDSAEADRFLDSALDRGHEGVMVKSLSAPYEA